MTVATQLTSARADYTEVYQTWSATSASTWQVKDLSGAPFNVPADAVVEVAIRAKAAALMWGGVREVGSGLERRFQVCASADAHDVTVMHVQADSNSQIEHYSGDLANLDFVLIGYWDSGTYVEAFSSFVSTKNGQWANHNLSTYGIGANEVAEIVMANGNHQVARAMGVRTDGSNLTFRRIVISPSNIQYAANTETMFVRAGASADATIDVFTDVLNLTTFHLVGYWSTNPGEPDALTYSQILPSAGAPDNDATWEDLSLASRGVPGSSVAEVIFGNASTTEGNNLGVRANGSSLGRLFDLRAGDEDGSDLGRMHVATDSSAVIEIYHEDVSDGGGFQVVGYWGLCGATITESDDSTEVEEGCTTDSYTIVLDSAPNASVTITVDPDAQTDVGSGAGVAIDLTFLITTWDTAQTVTVTPVDDFDVEDSHTSTITHTASSSDADYDGISISNVVADITDNDPFTLTSLGALGSDDSFGYGINDNAYITGYDEDPNDDESAWYWNGSTLTGLGTLGGDTSQGLDINDSAEIVGLAETADGHMRAFLWDGSMEDLGTLSGRADSEAHAINENGEVVGTALNTDGKPSNWLAFIYLPSTAYSLTAGMNSLGTLGGAGSVARDVNDAGQVVGGAQDRDNNMRPFLWLPADAYGLTAGMNDLGTLGGESPRIIHRAQAINNHGEVVGLSYTAGGDAHAFIWLPADAYSLSAGMNDLGTLTGGDTSWAFGINDSGRVVGTSNITGGDFHAFLWEDGKMYDLNDVLDPNDGWEMLWATAVNNDGEITGWATNGSSATRALLLTQPCSGGARWDGPSPDTADATDMEAEGALLTPTACGSGACGAGAAPAGVAGMGALIGVRTRRRGRQRFEE